MERNETGRIGYIDALKGFAILCVVMGHTALSFDLSGMFPDAYGFLNTVHDVIYAFHMPLFMMVSGYMYARAYVPRGGVFAKNVSGGERPIWEPCMCCSACCF